MDASEYLSAGKFLKAADIQRPVTCTISQVTEETSIPPRSRDTNGTPPQPEAKDHWLSVTILGCSKKLSLQTKTNLRSMIEMHGSETDDWLGKQFILYVDPYVEFRGEITSGLRIRPIETESGPFGADTHTQVSGRD